MKVFTMKVLILIAATGLLGAAEGFAADTKRVDVIGTIDKTLAQLDSQRKPTEGQVMRVDVIDSVGSQGPVFSSASATMRVDVIDSVESQGPVHSSTSVARSVGVIDSLLMVGSPLASVKKSGENVMRVDVIDSLPADSQWDSMKATGDSVKRVDVIDRIESRGPVYPSTSGAMRVDVIDNTRV